MLQSLPEESPKKNTLTPGWRQAIAVGVAQAISIIPGISRSGATVATGVFLNMSRAQAFKFSFFLSIPAILGASLLEVVDTISQTQSFSLTLTEILGMLAAFIGGLLSLKIFSLVIHKAQLRWFGYYVIVVGILSGLYFILF